MIKSSKMELDKTKQILKVWEVIPVSTLAPFTKITKNKKNGLLTPNTDTKSINNQLILLLLVIVYKSFCLRGIR